MQQEALKRHKIKEEGCSPGLRIGNRERDELRKLIQAKQLKIASEMINQAKLKNQEKIEI